MGVCWHNQGDLSSSKSKNGNQIIIASSYKPSKNDNNNNNNNSNNNPKKNLEEIFLNDSLEESYKQFPDMPEWGEGITKGYGIKEMPGYKCNLKIDELAKQRELFWQSKNSRKNQWRIVHQACIYDHTKAEEYLFKNNFKTKNGCINMCIDDMGNVYRVPNYCINDPVFVLEILPKKEKTENIEICLVDDLHQKKTKIKVKDSITGDELAKVYAEKNNIDLDKNKIRFIFGGGFIKGEDSLYQHKVKNGYKVQVCISKIE